MKRNDAEQRIEELRSQIRNHDHRYYVKNDPVVSDYEYDSLLKELESLEEQFPDLITPDSPTQRVSGEAVKEFTSVEHKAAMLSLDNTYSFEELGEFHKRVLKKIPQCKYVVEPKIDGLGVALVYEDGMFIRGATRGDGRVGEDVTFNLKTIRSIPLSIEDKRLGNIEVRGEVYMPLKGFREMNKKREEEGEQIFANPRNAAAGTIRQLDPRIPASRPLDIFIYSLSHMKGKAHDTHWDNLMELKKAGFKINPLARPCENLEEVIEYCKELEQKRDELGYEIDGTVIKVNELTYQRLLGETAKHPRWSIAYKFKARQATTRLLKIDWQVGRTGRLTPVAHLDPVELGGVKVSRATLHNEDEINRKDLRVGDIVLVERSGDVIPQVVKPITDKRTGNEKPFEMITQCPECGENVFRPEGEVVTRCQNLTCPAQLKRRISHFASRNAMDIEHLGPETVESLLDAGLIKSLDDLYALHKESMLKLEGFEEKSVQNLLAAIERSKKTDLVRLIFALGITHVGRHAAQLFAERFNNLNALTQAQFYQLENIKGIGKETAQSTVAFFSDKANQELIKNLEERGVRPIAIKKGPLDNTQFVFTGSLESMSRGDASLLVTQAGGIVSNSVSKNTDFVVAGEKPGSKLKKAKKLGIRILNEEEFRKIVEG